MAEEELSASWKDHALEPAWRMRAVFEQKVMAPYRDTYRGDLGPAQVEALEELYQAGKLRQQELAAALRITKQHASKIAARLEGRGFARQVPDDEDSRCRKVCLTDAVQPCRIDIFIINEKKSHDVDERRRGRSFLLVRNQASLSVPV